MFMLRHRVYATLGKEAEVRDFMTDWVRHAQEEGESVALAQRIFSSEGPVLVVARRYDDLVALDERRRANQADADWQARVVRLSAMIREPVRQTLEESLVPPIASTGPIGIVLRAFFSRPGANRPGALHAQGARPVASRRRAVGGSASFSMSSARRARRSPSRPRTRTWPSSHGSARSGRRRSRLSQPPLAR